MSQAEFDAYNRRYEGQQAFAARWAQAGPAGGAPWNEQVEMHAAHAWDQYLKNRRHGMNPDDAAAWAAVSEIESGGNYLKKQNRRRPGQRPGPGEGLYQWGSPKKSEDRRIAFSKIMGVPALDATEEQQFQFRDWELANTHKRARRMIDAAQGAGAKAAAITQYYEQLDDDAQEAFRSALADAISRRAKLVGPDY